MAIELSKDAKRQLIQSVQRYVKENFDEEIGDLKADLFLDFCLREIGPCVYNQAISDAQVYMKD